MNPSSRHPISLVALATSLWRHRQLIAQLTKREITGRYRGSVLGILWSFFNPMLLLAVYTFVFSVVFQARWSGGTESKAEFAIVLFVGLIVYGIFSECINRAPSLVLGNPNYVKKIVFPLDIMPWIPLGVSLFHAGISMFVLLAFYLLVHHSLHWTIVFLPIVLLPLILLVVGLSWFLASLGVFLRDVGQAVVLLTTVLMFTSPVFYPLASVPQPYGDWLALSPLAIIIEQARGVLIWGAVPDWTLLAGTTLISLLLAWLGFAWFQATRREFADVM